MSDIILLGAGNLGCALLKGWITSDNFDQSIKVITKSGIARDQSLANNPRLTFTNTMPNALSNETIVIIAVKPCMISDAFAPFANLNSKRVVSVAAGVSMESLQSIAPSTQITRAMPTIAAATHQSCTALLNADANITSLFDRLGKTVKVENDHQIDVATMLGASGAGFLYHIYQSMMDEAVAKGLSHENAQSILMSLIKGCADTHDFQSVIATISTKGGTTGAMINAGDRDLKKALTSAFDEGIKRAQNLDKAFKSQNLS